MSDKQQTALLDWFKQNKRNLPWREKPHWYHTFLSEFLLQQTQVEQALPYYDKFLRAFPDISALAKAGEDDVLNLWAGLGYYARARNMLKAARQIQTEHQGRFPVDWKQALDLPGIGPYTAAAILSIAFNQPYAVLDGNALRVLSRLHLIGDDIRLPATRKQFQILVDEMLDRENPGDFNESMMELGATICLPRNPDCQHCPLNSFCEGHRKGSPEKYPFKSAPATKKQLRHYVFLLENDKRLFIRQRPEKGLLARMWEFPYWEVDQLNLTEKQIEKFIKTQFGSENILLECGTEMNHIYSHIRLEYIPVWVIYNQNGKLLKGKWLAPEQLLHIALHGAHKKIIAA